jgi:hypothetical protein
LDELLEVSGSELRFEVAIIEAVDSGLLVLGESAKHAIYYHIETGYHVRREDVPRRIESFQEALRGLLGEGSAIIERMIAKDLHSKLGIVFEEHENWTLTDYVKQAKSMREKGGLSERRKLIAETKL